jgi:chromosome segregation ATPase
MTQPIAPAPTDRLQALRQAIADVSASVGADVGDDDVAAINCVIGLESALKDLGALLDIIPGLLELASLGPDVDGRVTTKAAEVGRRRAELVTLRARLDAERELTQQLEGIKAERDRIADQLAELYRVKEIAEELPGLRETVSRLQESIGAADQAQAEQVIADLTLAVRTIAELTSRQREMAGAELAAAADEVVTAARRTTEQREQLATLNDQLAAQVAEAEQLRVEAELNLPALQMHLQADATLVQGLDDAGIGTGGAQVTRVRGVLDELAQVLADLDNDLKPLLIAHAQAYEQAREIRR